MLVEVDIMAYLKRNMYVLKENKRRIATVKNSNCLILLKYIYLNDYLKGFEITIHMQLRLKL